MSIDDQVLEIIMIEGGKAHVQRVAKLMNIGFDYARSILYSLGRRDFIDIGLNEIAVLTDKGNMRLEKEREKEKQFEPSAWELEIEAMDRRMKPYREKDESIL
jgi:Mn-dependent DtxR family transcriptional regulator